MRSAKRRTIPGKSLSALTPKEPVQNVIPFARSGEAAINAAKSLSVLTTRGKPNKGNGGSSGWMHKLMPNSCAKGAMDCTKKCKFSRN